MIPSDSAHFLSSYYICMQRVQSAFLLCSSCWSDDDLMMWMWIKSVSLLPFFLPSDSKLQLYCIRRFSQPSLAFCVFLMQSSGRRWRGSAFLQPLLLLIKRRWWSCCHPMLIHSHSYLPSFLTRFHSSQHDMTCKVTFAAPSATGYHHHLHPRWLSRLTNMTWHGKMKPPNVRHAHTWWHS